MDQNCREMIVSQYRDLRDYARELVDAIEDEQMTLQPVPVVVMNHPAWILSHLAPYGPLLDAILRREPPIDPIDLPHSRKTSPSADPADYLTRRELIENFTRGYDAAADALLEAEDSIFSEPPPLERFRDRFPTIRDLPVQFLIKHPATHLGQLSAWRRAMGLGPV